MQRFYVALILTLIFLWIQPLNAQRSARVACTPPVGLNASGVSSTSADISWQSNPSARRYKLRYKVSGSNPWTTLITSQTQVILTNLAPGTTYKIKVKSICQGSSSRYTSTQSFTTTSNCPIPTGLNTLGVGSHQATLLWTFNPSVSSYNVRHRESGTASWINTPNVPSNLLVVNNLDLLTNYEFQVESICGATTSGFSASDTFNTRENVCTIPTNLLVNAVSTSTATISWGSVGGAVTYSARYREVGTSTWIPRGFIPGPIVTLIDLFPNTNYEFQVEVDCTLGATGYSSSVFFTTDQITICEVSQNLYATQIGTTWATMNWEAVIGAINYTVRRRVSGTSTWTFQHTTDQTSLMTSLLSPNTSYEFQVQTHCTIGSSAFSASAFFTTQADNCPVPQNFTAYNVTATSANFSWDAAAGAINYVLEHREQGTSSWSTYTTSLTLAVRSNLTHSTTYEARVKANCGGGAVSDYSPIITFTTLAGSNCPTPGGLFTLGIGSTQATLLWGSVNAALSYEVRWRIVGTSTWSNQPVSGTNLLVVFGLIPAMNYEFQVLSNCAGESSPFSPSSFFTTNASAFTGSNNSSFPGLMNSDLSIYPNPATDKIKVSSTEEMEGFFEIKIFNLQAQLVHQEKYFGHSLRDGISLDVNKLVPGHYQLSILTQNNRVIKIQQFVILK